MNMKLNIKQALKLFDERHDEHAGLATSIISMIGEDLGAGSFARYRAAKKLAVKPVYAKFQAVGFPPGHGPRLDRWLVDKKRKIIYQCEIKSFCSYATNGADIRKKDVKLTSEEYWKKLLKAEFSNTKEYGKTSKVLVKMERPEAYSKYRLEPLLILWWPVSSGKELLPFFSVSVSRLGTSFTKFKKMHVFSVSLYLRKLRGSTIHLEMPNVKKRLRALHQIVR